MTTTSNNPTLSQNLTNLILPWFSESLSLGTSGAILG